MVRQANKQSLGQLVNCCCRPSSSSSPFDTLCPLYPPRTTNIGYVKQKWVEMGRTYGHGLSLKCATAYYPFSSPPPPWCTKYHSVPPVSSPSLNRNILCGGGCHGAGKYNQKSLRLSLSHHPTTRAADKGGRRQLGWVSWRDSQLSSVNWIFIHCRFGMRMQILQDKYSLSVVASSPSSNIFLLSHAPPQLTSFSQKCSSVKRAYPFESPTQLGR